MTLESPGGASPMDCSLLPELPPTKPRFSNYPLMILHGSIERQGVISFFPSSHFNRLTRTAARCRSRHGPMFSSVCTHRLLTNTRFSRTGAELDSFWLRQATLLGASFSAEVECVFFYSSPGYRHFNPGHVCAMSISFGPCPRHLQSQSSPSQMTRCQAIVSVGSRYDNTGTAHTVYSVRPGQRRPRRVALVPWQACT